MGWPMIVCQCLIFITCLKFCRAYYCVELENLTMKTDKEELNMQNAKDMAFCSHPALKEYEITEIREWKTITFFAFIDVDITYVYNKSLRFIVRGNDFNGQIACKFKTRDAASVFLKGIRSVLTGYAVNKLVQHWLDSDHRPIELSRPAELYVKNTAGRFEDYNDSRMLSIWSQVLLGNQIPYLNIGAMELALSEIAPSNALCLCVKNSNRAFVLYFPNEMDAKNFKYRDIGPYTDLKIKCNFPEKLQGAKRKTKKSIVDTLKKENSADEWIYLEFTLQ